MKTIKLHLNSRQIILALSLIMVGFSSHGSVNPKALESQASVARSHEENLVVEAQAGINFNEWESDFNKAVRESRAMEVRKCKGKNCHFKNMQALDPSFEL